MFMRSSRITGWLLFLTMAALLAGCAHAPKEEPPKGSYLEDIYVNTNTDMDLESFNTAMPPYLEYLDNQVMEASEDPLLCRVSGAFYGHAFCFVEDVDKNRARVLYLKGRAYVMKELKRYRRFDEAVTFSKPVDAFRDSLPGSFNKKNLPVLYWAAMNWAGWVNLNLDKPEAVADIPKVEAMLEFINSLDDKYKHGSVHAMLGSMYANRSKEDGGDPERAKEEFDKAFACSDNGIFTYHVMFARYYATRIQDRELFRKTLATIIETPANPYADRAFLNEVARKKAKLLMNDIDTYFRAAEQKGS